MGWPTLTAIYFIMWWTVLFAVLPVGIRSQAEDQDIILGTEHGAPTSFSFGRKALHTTWVSLLVFAAFYLLIEVYGFGLDSFPNFLPIEQVTPAPK